MPRLSSFALKEEVARLSAPGEQDSHPRQFAPGCEGQPWCAVMLGQALPPADGQPPRVYSAVRCTQSSRGPTLWRWDGERRQVGPSAAVEYWTSLPPYARVLDLSEPSPVGLLTPGGWRVGPWVRPDWREAAEARVRSVMAPLKGLELSLIFFDAEDRCDPWELQKTGQWDAVLADERLPALLAESQISREDLLAIGKLKPAQAGLDMRWHRWCEVTHRLLAEQIAEIGRWIAESGVRGTVVNASHYHKIPTVCAPERGGVYHAAVRGAGSTPGGASVVKQYGLNDRETWDAKIGANIEWPDTDWARVLRDARRILGCHQAGWGRVVALGQANVTDPSGPLGWLTSKLGPLSQIFAGIVSGEPLIYSQRQNDPKEKPAECLAQQREIETILAALDLHTGGMGCRATWRESFPWFSDSSLSITFRDSSGVDRGFLVGAPAPPDQPQPPTVVREYLPPKLVTGEVHLTSGDYARTALVVSGDAEIHFDGAEIQYGRSGEDLSQGIHLLSESSDDGVSRRLAAELGIELGQGTIARHVQVSGPGRLALGATNQPWRCHGIAGGGDAGQLKVNNLELTSGGVDGGAIWVPYRSTRLEKVLALGASQHKNRPDALPAVMVGQRSYLVDCAILGGQAAVQVRDASEIQSCFLSARGPFTGAYALPLLSVNQVQAVNNLILGDRGILLERDGAGPTCDGNNIRGNTILCFEPEKTGVGNFGRDGTAYGIRTRYGTQRNVLAENMVFAFGGGRFTGCAAAGLTDYPVAEEDANFWQDNRLCAAYCGPRTHPGDFAKALTIESGGGPEAATSGRPAITRLSGNWLETNHRGLSLAGYDGLGYTTWWNHGCAQAFELMSFLSLLGVAEDAAGDFFEEDMQDWSPAKVAMAALDQALIELAALADTYGDGQQPGAGFLWRGVANKAPLWPGLNVAMPAEYLLAGWHLAADG